MKKYLCILLTFTGYFSFLNLNASHIVGGYITYSCIGAVSNDSADYDVTMFFYRDCRFGNGGTQPRNIPITVFNSNNNNLVSTSILNNLLKFDTLDPNINNPCIVPDASVCVEEYVFQGIIRLRRSNPHTLVFQRCCKSNHVDNLPFPSDDYGSSYTTTIPAFNVLSCNSTPSYDTIPPLYFCVGFDVNIDLSATDPDGDSLVYSLCAPLDYSNSFNPLPFPANPPPYSTLPFISGLSATNPIPATPQIAIHPSTGRLSGTPTNIGRYAFGICIEEYRNGILINVLRREVEVTTKVCDVVVNSAVQDQDQFCNGLTVQFENNSTSSSGNPILDYYWDFGVLNSMADTSRDFEPTFTYPDTGTYRITLISYPSFPACTDTVIDTFIVKQLLDPGINKTGSFCEDGSNISVNVNGSFESYAAIKWDFGSQANISNSNNDTVMGISYPPGPGSYPIQLIVEQDNCMDTVNDVLTLVPNPLLSFGQSDSAGCYPLPVNFNSSISPPYSAEYDWDFGDGGGSNLANPTHTYLQNGYFDVGLTVRTLSGCIDTLVLTKDSAVYISLDSSTNKIDFLANPVAGCAPLEVDFLNASVFEGTAQFDWNFGDGNTTSNVLNPTNIYQNNGVYSVGVSMITKDKCVDTLFLQLDSIINVSLDSSTNEIKFDYSPKEGCAPLSVQFTDSSIYEGNADYFWDFGDGTLGTTKNPIKTYADTGSYSIGLLLIPTDKCVDTLVKTVPNAIRVLPRPTAKINASDTMASLKKANFQFTNSGSEFAANSRYLINGIEVGTNDILTYQFTDTGRYIVDYIAINGFGCEDTSSVEVFVFDEFLFIIPNIFTPNDDFINDEFAMRACGVYDYHINIFNRFGEKIFTSNNLNINWDGRISGRKASEGVYFYTIQIKDFRGEFLDFNGTVTLLRK